MKKLDSIILKILRLYIEYSNDMQDFYKNINEYNPKKKCINVLIVFDHMIADMISYKNLSSKVIEAFIWGRKLNISLVFITQSYYKVLKEVRLNTTHSFIMKIPNKRKLEQTALNHSSDIDLMISWRLIKCVLQNHILF